MEAFGALTFVLIIAGGCLFLVFAGIVVLWASRKLNKKDDPPNN